MQDQFSQKSGTNLTANLLLVLVNLIWVLLAVWSTWGFGALIIFAAVLNHLITRYAHFKHRRAVAASAQKDPDTGAQLLSKSQVNPPPR